MNFLIKDYILTLFVVYDKIQILLGYIFSVYEINLMIILYIIEKSVNRFF